MIKKFFHVDAFTDACFGGNPAGVIMDSKGLNDVQMQKIAREVNLSETAFIFESEDEDYDYEIRFFTPTEEVDLCGHATIAAFHILSRCNLSNAINNKLILKQKTKAGILPVELNFIENKLESVMMSQSTPKFYDIDVDVYELSTIMGLDSKDIGIESKEAKPEIVSTGLKDIILPVKDIIALKRINPDFDKLKTFSSDLGVIGVHAFALHPEKESSNLACRNFAPAVGINEEAATGTSNGALGAYLVRNNIYSLEGHIKIICDQGYYMDRPSKILVDIEGTKEEMVVKVGGSAVTVLNGIINI